jgi:hypothetical protein
MHVCMDIQVNLYVSFNTQVNMSVLAHLQVNIHQTCTYIDESANIYVYTHKYALKNEYLDEYVYTLS